MSALIVALMLAFPPQPKVASSDDFDAVLATNELANHCQAMRIQRSEPDDIRLVEMKCPGGEQTWIFIFRGEDGWFIVTRTWRAPGAI